MVWSTLPDDMEGLILGNLSLAELGRVSMTCRSFHGFFSRRVAELQKARCELAVDCFGHGMVTGIADIISRFLKSESLDSKLAYKRNYCHFSPDGLLQVDDADARQMPAHHKASSGVRETVAMINFHAKVHNMSIHVCAPDRACVDLWVRHAEKEVQIVVGGNRDLVGRQGLALVQALLSKGLDPKADAWPHVHVIIQKVGSTRAERRAEFAPLLHLRPQLPDLRIDWWDR